MLLFTLHLNMFLAWLFQQSYVRKSTATIQTTSIEIFQSLQYLLHLESYYS